MIAKQSEKTHPISLAHPLGSNQGIALASFAWTAAMIVSATLLYILGDVFFRGIDTINWDFLTSEPRLAGRQGGIGPIIISTLWILGIAMGTALPLAIITAVFLAEFTPQGGLLGRFIRFSLDVLAGVPSIVFGLFGNVFFCKTLGMGFSILSGGLTLACMALPLMIRATEESIRLVPRDYRYGAHAVCLPAYSALWHITLPTALPGIVAGLVLGIGRALAETAALIFTSGYVDRMPESVMDSGRALSVHIYDLSMNVSGGDKAAYASSLTLICMLLAINTFTASLVRWLRPASYHR